jgi:DnaD/phage-associated family protein
MDFIRISDIDNERFYKIPKMLFLNPKYKSLSVTAKVAYGMIKDRMELSKKHGWVDKDGRVYVFFKQAQLAEFLGVTERTIKSIFAELKLAGLLETQKQGMCKPAKVYLMKVDTCMDEAEEFSTEGQNLPHGGEENFTTEGKYSSPSRGSRLPSNETEISETEKVRHKDDDDNVDRDWQNVLKAYQDNINPLMGGMELDKLGDLFDSFGAKWVTEAISKAIEHNARSLSYMTAVLEQWHRDGFKVDNRKKKQPFKKNKGYSQDEYAKVLEKLKEDDKNAGNG